MCVHMCTHICINKHICKGPPWGSFTLPGGGGQVLSTFRSQGAREVRSFRATGGGFRKSWHLILGAGFGL